MSPKRSVPLLLALSALVMAGGCARVQRMSSQECLARAMYFESNRSSEAGMMAVGTVVMNRLESGRYPKSVCGVVGQKNQFAPGVLSKPMGKGKDLAVKTARQVLKGKRHPSVQKAMFFHTAGYSYPYTNMNYLTIQGGNAFYEKRKNAKVTQAMVAEREGRLPFTPPERTLAASAAQPPAATAAPSGGRAVAQQTIPTPVVVTTGNLEAMSIEDLIRQSGG